MRADVNGQIHAAVAWMQESELDYVISVHGFTTSFVDRLSEVLRDRLSPANITHIAEKVKRIRDLLSSYQKDFTRSSTAFGGKMW